MDLELKNRTCLVTGASAGIGEGIARVMEKEGARLAITARRASRLDALADEIATDGYERPLVIPAALTAAQAPAEVAAALEAQWGGVSILVNNAGGSTPMVPHVDDDAWETSFRLNFTAARRLTALMIPAMQRSKWGRIINITGSMEPTGTNAAQAGSATTLAWAKGLSRDLGAEGITVNCIPPGRIDSEQIRERIHPSEESRREFTAQNIPAGYFGEPEDVAYLVAFLSSPLARYISGTVIYVDGGMHRFVH